MVITHHILKDEPYCTKYSSNIALNDAKDLPQVGSVSR